MLKLVLDLSNASNFKMGVLSLGWILKQFSFSSRFSQSSYFHRVGVCYLIYFSLAMFG